MSYELLMQIAVDYIVFSELTDEKGIDPDYACNIVEGVAATLGDLPPDERACFLEYLQRRAQTTTDPRERDLLVKLPEMLGMVPEEDDLPGEPGLAAR